MSDNTVGRIGNNPLFRPQQQTAQSAGDAKYLNSLFGNGTNLNNLRQSGNPQLFGSFQNPAQSNVNGLDLLKSIQSGDVDGNKYLNKQLGTDSAWNFANVVKFSNDSASMDVWRERFKNQPDRFFRDHYGMSKEDFYRLDDTGMYNTMMKLADETAKSQAEAGGTPATFSTYDAPTEYQDLSNLSEDEVRQTLVEDWRFLSDEQRAQVLPHLTPEQQAKVQNYKLDT